jgi:hypothetical protein
MLAVHLAAAYAALRSCLDQIADEFTLDCLSETPLTLSLSPQGRGQHERSECG